MQVIKPDNTRHGKTVKNSMIAVDPVVIEAWAERQLKR